MSQGGNYSHGQEPRQIKEHPCSQDYRLLQEPDFIIFTDK